MLNCFDVFCSGTPLQCNAGFYCGTAGMTNISTAMCQTGAYCPPGQSVISGLPCPIGSYCPSGASGFVYLIEFQ
jgi:hypothetical protein